MAPTPFPPYPVRGVHVLHQKQNCAPHFAEITLDFEPAAEGFVFEVAEGLVVDYEPAEQVPRFFEASAAGVREQLALPEHGLVVAARVILRQARAHVFGSHELAFRIAGYLAAARAVEHVSGQGAPVHGRAGT
ncbi:hypothetical protein [Streptomyces sp. NPDC002851]